MHTHTYWSGLCLSFSLSLFFFLYPQYQLKCLALVKSVLSAVDVKCWCIGYKQKTRASFEFIFHVCIAPFNPVHLDFSMLAAFQSTSFPMKMKEKEREIEQLLQPPDTYHTQFSIRWDFHVNSQLSFLVCNLNHTHSLFDWVRAAVFFFSSFFIHEFIVMISINERIQWTTIISVKVICLVLIQFKFVT